MFSSKTMSTAEDKQTQSKKDRVLRKNLKPAETLRVAKEYLKKGQYVEAIPFLERIEEYVIEAAFVLGVIYFDGLGVDVDLKRGISYMEKISQVSSMRPEEEFFVRQAQFNLGTLCYRGFEMPKSDEDAERYWLMAASGKNDPQTGKPHPPTVEAQTALGKFYGLESTRNEEKSFYWHNKALFNGSIESEAALGMMLMCGSGVPEDPMVAYLYLLNASLKGSVYAYGVLVSFYYTRKLYFKVVELGEWISQIEDVEAYAEHCSCTVEDVRMTVSLGCFYLALCYQYGQSVQKDLNLAKRLIKKAVDLNVKLAMNLHARAILGDL